MFIINFAIQSAFNILLLRKSKCNVALDIKVECVCKMMYTVIKAELKLRNDISSRSVLILVINSAFLGLISF